jgi:hypothetical protein
MKTLKTVMALLCLVFACTFAHATTLNNTSSQLSDVPNYLKSAELRKKQAISNKAMIEALKAKGARLATNSIGLSINEVEDESAFGWVIQLQGNNNSYYFDSEHDGYFNQGWWTLPSINPDNYTLTVSPYFTGSYGTDCYFDIDVQYNDCHNVTQDPYIYNLDWYSGYDQPGIFSNVDIGDYAGNYLQITLGPHSDPF